MANLFNPYNNYPSTQQYQPWQQNQFQQQQPYQQNQGAFQQQMQPQNSNNMFSQYSQTNIMQTPSLQGRYVGGIDEVKALTANLDGSVTYYPQTDRRMIYSKYIDQDGATHTDTYVLQNSQNVNQSEMATQQDIIELNNKIQILTEKLEGFINEQSNKQSSE